MTLSINFIFIILFYVIGSIPFALILPKLLGLGDISPRQDIKSIQEDPFPEIFVGSSLWEFDVQMIKQLYGENNN